MAQNSPHDHQDTASSNKHSFVPRPTMTLFPGLAQNDNTGYRISSPVGMDASKGKEVVPNITGDNIHKGKGSLPTADDGNLKVNIIMQRERQRKMKDMFRTLHELLPHVPAEKVDRETLVGETIDFIKALEQTKAQLEKQKQEQTFARQGMVGLQTWSTPNVVLSIVNDKAIINVRAPKKPCMLSLVLSVLNKHGIDVVSAQVSADSAGSFFTIYTHVDGGARGNNPSVEDIYKLAASEIAVWLSS